MSTPKRPPCVLFSVNEANETDVEVMKKLCDAGYEIVVVQEENFEKALKIIESVRKESIMSKIKYIPEVKPLTGPTYATDNQDKLTQNIEMAVKFDTKDECLAWIDKNPGFKFFPVEHYFQN
jgi:hypothetical protein